jgi:hypothetical protein
MIKGRTSLIISILSGSLSVLIFYGDPFNRKITLLSLSCQYVFCLTVSIFHLPKNGPLLALRINLSMVSLSPFLISINLTPIPAGFFSFACA